MEKAYRFKHVGQHCCLYHTPRNQLTDAQAKVRRFLSFETAQKYLWSFKVKCKNRSLASKDKVFLFENNSKSFYVFRTWCHSYDKYIWNVQLLPKEVS